MNSILLTRPIEINNRLNSLGWTREDLIEVVNAMVSARNDCTDNDPPGAPGWKSWCHGTRRLREIGTLMDLVPSDAGQISSVYDRERGIHIAVCNTDSGTGVPESQPNNRSKKGNATDRAVNANQTCFQPILDESLNTTFPNGTGEVVYWYLCVYSEGDVVRAELSLPICCDNGFFTAFHERIFLIGEDDGSIGGRVSRKGPDITPEFDINVTRKQA